MLTLFSSASLCVSLCSLKKSLSDDLVKKAFVSQFTTGVITFSIVDEKYSAPEKELATWNLYNGQLQGWILHAGTA